jgi:hypothetical protein
MPQGGQHMWRADQKCVAMMQHGWPYTILSILPAFLARGLADPLLTAFIFPRL